VRVALAAVALVLLSGSATAQSFSDLRLPYVQFQNAPSLPKIAFQQGRPEEDGRKADTGMLWARLSLLPGRTPLVLLLHGCGGMGNAATENWIKQWAGLFQARGYSAMALDSFSSRGVKATCGPPDAHWSYRRRDDAYSALAWLSTQGRTDMDRVVVMGRSNGGRTVLRIMEEKMKAVRPQLFARGIAMYPNCKDDEKTLFYRPVHVFIGADDDANPAVYCKSMARAGATNLQVTVFPGTLHGFDDGSKTRTEYGWRMGGNSRSTEEVQRLIDADIAH
jgi:dienelactone hydrolase